MTDEEVKIEIVGDNISKRTLTYKGNTTEIHAVYPSLTVPPICWAGRLDGGLSKIPHQIAFVGVTIEEAAREFKKWVDACELGRKAFTEQAPPKKKRSLFDMVIEYEVQKGTPEALAFAAYLALTKSTWSDDDE